MANSPVQIVLNSNDFITSLDKKGGGPNKDFYADNDAAFIAHKRELAIQLSTLKEKQISNPFSEVSYAKLTIKQSALAKSHRPTSQLFVKDVAPVVGGGDLGEIFVRLDPISIDKIGKKVSQAEEETRWKTQKDGKKKPNPSQLRSEVGAINEIVPYTPADKRKFTISEGIQWLSKPQTGGAYIVELFQTPPPRQEWDRLSPQEFKLFKSFSDGLSNFGNGTVAMRLIDANKNTPMIGVRLEDSSSAPNIQFLPVQSSIKRQSEIKKLVVDLDKHSSLINFLESHPLVKKIALPPIITKSQNVSRPLIGDPFVIPTKVLSKTYPKIAVVDGGISSILNNWVEDSWGLISSDDKDEEHGTFIAGLLLSGNSINGSDICPEEDGCSIIDLDLLPRSDVFDSYYQNKPLLFFSELEYAVREIKARTGVRVFNFSLNVEDHVSSNGYSYPAQVLDKIAEENDVIFVISAGNTAVNDIRKEWPSNPIDALSILANSRNDTIKTPSESGRNLSVAAINPPSMIGIVPFAPSSYSCRGPGMRVGLKPDLAHIGGSGTRVVGSHGLLSINSSGNLIDGCGTSYAAPNVAKSIATIEHAIEGNISRETLMGLAIHHAYLPKVLQDPQFKDVTKHLVGFGVPSSAATVLEGNDSAITLVFANRIGSGLRMSFNFSWPQMLVRGSKCYGKARLTIVSTPPFDYNFGAEFVRVNVEGYLRQHQSDGSYKGRLDSVYLPSTKDKKDKLYEKNLIEHSLKWSPVKVSEKEFHGVGPSTDWRLDVEYLTRAGETIPFNGVPFTAILTISDPEGKKPIFNTMRQSLQSLGVNMLDIRTASRVVPRV